MCLNFHVQNQRNCLKMVVLKIFKTYCSVYLLSSIKYNKEENLYMPITLNIYDKSWFGLLKYMKNSKGI